MKQHSLGFVAIGRNEAPRLTRCLASILQNDGIAVYVDSGSSDGSVNIARGHGLAVVELDASVPYTAARARNAGMEQLLAQAPQPDYVQFVDGDSTLSPGWCAAAADFLDKHPQFAAVFGRLHESEPDASPYNALFAIEFELHPGEVENCAGIAMMRVRALMEVEGFDRRLISGEERDLCLRLRKAGWKIQALDEDMAVHDGDLRGFSQWWLRTLRTGHTYAEAAMRHTESRDRSAARKLASTLFWGLLLPLAAMAPAWHTGGASALLMLAYPLQYLRIVQCTRQRGFGDKQARLYGAFVLLGKLPESIGTLRYMVLRLLGKQSRIIEHK